MAILSLDGWSKFTNAIAKIAKAISLLGAILLYCVATYLGTFTDAIKYIFDRIVLLQGMDMNQISHASFAGLDMISYVNGVFPLSEMIGCVTVYTTAWIILITIRWCKSFIPTIAN